MIFSPGRPARRGNQKTPVAQRALLRIGVDATCWQSPRGFGRHSRCLLSALLQVDRRNRYTFFTDAPEAVAQMPREAEVRLVPTSAPTIAGAAARTHRRLIDLFRMSLAMSRARLDALLFPAVFSYVPVIGRARKLVIFHDITAEAYPALTLEGHAARLLWKIKTALGRRQADALITVSEYSRAGLAQRFGLPAASIHVVGEAPDAAFRVLNDPEPTPRLRALGIGAKRRAIVYVGGFSPHKNLDRLIAAFACLSLQERFSDLDLVLAGENRNETFFTCFAAVRRQAHELGLDGRVIFTGFLPDDDLVVLLNQAQVLALPSMSEGFGLPAIEAAACGCPVVATAASPLPALLGEGGLYVDPARPGEIEQALVRVLDSAEMRARMGRAGVAAASRLSWDEAARRLVAIIESVAAGAVAHDP